MNRVSPVLVLLVAVAATPARAQLADLQPGRNFPEAVVAFGADGHTENIDCADVDNDGDQDVATANGGNGDPQATRLYINLGGYQGGSEGTFADETATRFLGAPTDRSRDVEFADLENDGDLDVFVVNHGTVLSGGGVSRAYANAGGVQLGTMGFFGEVTDIFWGTLASVPPEDEEGVVDGAGPWRGFSCDCDFGDLDDDGALDLFYSSYGPAIDGSRDSRVFLNDGAGVFHELWPWADAAADIRLHSIDVDLADFDGDFDLDVFASSRETVTRVYRNNLYGGTGAGEPFTDMTATALPDLGPPGEDAFNYESEFADMDGDGDLDVWVSNYLSNIELALRNDAGFGFALDDWIRGDPLVPEAEIDFLDYDGDGDLDAFTCNVLGDNSLWQSGLADGLLGQPLYHRTGTTVNGSLAPWPETPLAGSGGFTLDADAADVDGDGDPDLVLAHDFNQPNRLMLNALGVPDTHAPTFHAIQTTPTAQGLVVHAQVRDNAPYYAFPGYDVRLFYAVDGGAASCVPMVAQGGQQFRAVVPAGITGTIETWVQARDDHGNVGVSATAVDVVPGPGADVAWLTVDCGTPGTLGTPHLALSGSQLAGTPFTIHLRDAAPDALSILYVSAASNALPFKGGTLYTLPILFVFPLFSSPGGEVVLIAPWPAGLPLGTQIWFQFAIDDDGNPTGTSLSNAAVATQI